MNLQQGKQNAYNSQIAKIKESHRLSRYKKTQYSEQYITSSQKCKIWVKRKIKSRWQKTICKIDKFTNLPIFNNT